MDTYFWFGTCRFTLALPDWWVIHQLQSHDFRRAGGVFKISRPLTSQSICLMVGADAADETDPDRRRVALASALGMEDGCTVLGSRVCEDQEVCGYRNAVEVLFTSFRGERMVKLSCYVGRVEFVWTCTADTKTRQAMSDIVGSIRITHGQERIERANHAQGVRLSRALNGIVSCSWRSDLAADRGRQVDGAMGTELASRPDLAALYEMAKDGYQKANRPWVAGILALMGLLLWHRFPLVRCVLAGWGIASLIGNFLLFDTLRKFSAESSARDALMLKCRAGWHALIAGTLFLSVLLGCRLIAVGLLLVAAWLAKRTLWRMEQEEERHP